MMPVDYSRQLELADQHITRAERHIAYQRRLIARLTSDGHHTGGAQHMLRALEQSRAAFERHRRLIVWQMDGGA
jgi:hypothetical protein